MNVYGLTKIKDFPDEIYDYNFYKRGWAQEGHSFNLCIKDVETKSNLGCASGVNTPNTNKPESVTITI